MKLLFNFVEQYIKFKQMLYEMIKIFDACHYLSMKYTIGR